MSGFSAEWLALREPVDHRSRNLALQAQVIQFLEQIKSVVPGSIHITDLGSGTGSNLRALAPYLGLKQSWTLVDYDADLLRSARASLIAWADSVASANKGESKLIASGLIHPLTITKNSKTIAIEFQCADLALDYQAILDKPADLITAAAFFDLVAQPWLTEFCAALTQPLYTVLTYNGIEKWSPPEHIDADVLHAFHAHQSTDKGFGAALGPSGAERLQSLLECHGFTTLCAPSPWAMDEHDRALIEQLAIGTARAVREIGTLPNAAVSQWEHLRRNAEQCEIGHTDLFAYKA
jgi:hypothetical protein